MTDADMNERARAFVARARDGLGPTAADAARVRSAIGVALAAGAATAATAATTTARAAAPWGSKLVLVAVTAATAGGAGFWAGHRAGVREARRAPLAAAALTAPALAIAATAAPPPAAAGAAEAPRIPPLPTVPRPHPATGPAPHRPSEASSHAPALDRELAALRAVERALRDHRPGLALALLAALDRDVPSGALAEEREAMTAIARCSLGDAPFGIEPGALFAEHHPGSVYLQRVEQACAAQTERAPSGD
jgi:hypothetical protein